MKSKVTKLFLDYNLVGRFCYLALCKNEVEYLAICKQYKIKNSDFSTKRFEAYTEEWKRNDDLPIIIVCMERSKRTKLEQQLTLFHEAVHVWQKIKAHIGESNPSKEFEAYAIENIARALCNAWDKK